MQLCLAELPREPFVVDASKQIDTDKDSRCTSFTPANPAWCVISATRIVFRGTVTDTGAQISPPAATMP